MFQTPRTTSMVAPAEPLDVTARYLVRLTELVDEGVSKFADPNATDPAHNIRWVFRMGEYETRAPILDLDGNPYELWQYTSNKTGKARGKTAKAREWMEALLGRPLEDNEITSDMQQQLLEKIAVALLEEYEVERDGGTYTRIRILKLAPWREKEPAMAAAAPAPKVKAREEAIPF